jgi:hypothetical protein
MAAKETTAIAEKKDNIPAEYADYGQYAGSGFENQTQDDYSVPFLQILQAISPQLQENDALRQGMVINTVTGEVFESKSGLIFIPATTQHVAVEWKPRDVGGGYVGQHDMSSELVRNCAETQEFGNWSTPEGNELHETFYVYGVFIDESGSVAQAVLAFTSSKIKKYKGWMTKAKTIQITLPDGRRIPAPLFAHKYRLKTVAEKNNKGNYFNWDISFDGANALEARLLPSDPLFQAAVSIKTLIESGKARGAFESQSATHADESAEGTGKPVF